MNKTVVFTFGRFVIPTKGHLKLFTLANQLAKKNNADLRIYASHTVDGDKNPIPYDQKMKYLKLSFPEFDKNIIKSNSKTIFDVLHSLEGKYENVIMVVGQDRVKQFRDMIEPYLHKKDDSRLNFKDFKVVSAGRRDPESKDYIETLSSSYLRKMATDGQFDKFREGVSSKLKTDLVKDLYNKLRASKKEINKVEESMEQQDKMWQSFKQWYLIQDGKESRDEQPDSDFLVVDKKTGKRSLPVKKFGKLNARLMGAAHAALGPGYRGRKYDGPGKVTAKAKLKAYYKKIGKDMPGE
jgi:hypothetical protein